MARFRSAAVSCVGSTDPLLFDLGGLGPDRHPEIPGVGEDGALHVFAIPCAGRGKVGIVSNRYEPYPALLASMKRIKEHIYQIIDHFDAAK